MTTTLGRGTFSHAGEDPSVRCYCHPRGISAHATSFLPCTTASNARHTDTQHPAVSTNTHGLGETRNGSTLPPTGHQPMHLCEATHRASQLRSVLTPNQVRLGCVVPYCGLSVTAHGVPQQMPPVCYHPQGSTTRVTRSYFCFSVACVTLGLRQSAHNNLQTPATEPEAGAETTRNPPNRPLALQLTEGPRSY